MSYTLGSTTNNYLKVEESWSITKKFTGTTALTKGTVVKLNTAGTVTAVSATTDVAFGLVIAGSAAANEEVTVQTPFNAIVEGLTSGTVTTGDAVAAKEVDGTGPMQYKKAVTGDTVIGIALSTATTGLAVTVGLLRVARPHHVAAVVTALGTTTNLSAISATYADLAAARTSVNTLKGEVETRLDNIEAKLDEVIAALKTAGLMATS